MPQLPVVTDAERGVRNGIAVGIVRRVAERFVDQRLELLGKGMLEPVRLCVHGVDREAERLGEVLLEQAMVPDHLEGDALAGLGEPDAAVASMLGEAEDRELLQHRGGGRRSHAHRLGDLGRGRATAGRLKLVDLLQVVLDRLGQLDFRHVSKCRHELDGSPAENECAVLASRPRADPPRS